MNALKRLKESNLNFLKIHHKSCEKTIKITFFYNTTKIEKFTTENLTYKTLMRFYS